MKSIKPITSKSLTMGLTIATVMVLLLSVVSTASATVKPYLFDNSRSHEMALESLVFLSQEPPEPEEDVSRIIELEGMEGVQPSTGLTLTQQILKQAEIEYQRGLDKGQQSAMAQMLGYLQNSGVTQDLANILIDDIVDGAYEANQQVLKGLKIISAK